MRAIEVTQNEEVKREELTREQKSQCSRTKAQKRSSKNLFKTNTFTIIIASNFVREQLNIAVKLHDYSGEIEC